MPGHGQRRRHAGDPEPAQATEALLPGQPGREAFLFLRGVYRDVSVDGFDGL